MIRLFLNKHVLSTAGVMALCFTALLLGASVAEADECEWSSSGCEECVTDSCAALEAGDTESLEIGGGSHCYGECSGEWQSGAWDIRDACDCEEYNGGGGGPPEV